MAQSIEKAVSTLVGLLDSKDKRVKRRKAISGFELLSQAEYRELLKQTGFFVQQSQRSIFVYLKVNPPRLCGESELPSYHLR